MKIKLYFSLESGKNFPSQFHVDNHIYYLDLHQNGKYEY